MCTSGCQPRVSRLTSLEHSTAGQFWSSVPLINNNGQFIFPTWESKKNKLKKFKGHQVENASADQKQSALPPSDKQQSITCHWQSESDNKSPSLHPLCCVVCRYWRPLCQSRASQLSPTLYRSDGRSRQRWSCPLACRKKEAQSVQWIRRHSRQFFHVNADA